jgi:spermidine synthase
LSDIKNTTPKAGLYLVLATLLMAVSGLVYELLAGTISSYLLGDSVTQFSLVVGWFLTSMGIGSWFSRFIRSNHLFWLIVMEMSLGVLGGHMAIIGFVSFTYTQVYSAVLLTLIGTLGIGVGLEIPLVLQILKDIDSLRVTVANVLSADYIGALLASLLFPFILLPHLGMNQAGLLAGLANVLIAFWLVWIFRKSIEKGLYILVAGGIASLVLLSSSFALSSTWISDMESSLYQDKVLLTRQSPYQRIVLTRWKEDVRLYLNGHLQFSSLDEYRYHETLVHLPMMRAAEKRRVLILGGGDGMAVREVLKYPSVERVVLVDLDSVVTNLFSQKEMLMQLNDSSLADPRVEIINTDAFSYLQNNRDFFDVIMADLPDPSETTLSKLYSRVFYGLALRRLAQGGQFITQSTSPFRSREAFWCIHQTIESLADSLHQPFVEAVQVQIPTFGSWGFQLVSYSDPQKQQDSLQVSTRFLKQEMLPSLFQFPKDMSELSTQISTLDHPSVSHYYSRGYHKYLE